MADEPVIISGGSVQVKFNANAFTRDPNDPGKFNSTRSIKGIDIKDLNTGTTTTCQIPSNGKCEITIHCE